MGRLPRLFALACFLLALQAGPSAAEKRVALVVGNGAYAAEAMRLKNPPADAALMGRALENLGFEVETVADAGKGAMEAAVGRLAARARDADIALFYYGGQALQYRGANFLMPVDEALNAEEELPHRFLSLDDVLGKLADIKGKRIVVLDASRDLGPIAALRAKTPPPKAPVGLAQAAPAADTLILFATGAGGTLAETPGGSPLAKSLAARIREPGVELRAALKEVMRDVAAATGGRQIPAYYDSLIGEVFLRPGK